MNAPLLPLRVILDRNRGGAFLCLAISITGMFGLLLFLAFYLQVVLGFSPLRCGLAFLPLTAGMMTGATRIGTRLVPRLPARTLMAPGYLVAAAGLVILAQITPDSSYPAVVLPGMVVTGLGMGTALMPAMSLATHGVAPRDSGVASALVNTSQQIGGAIGTALLNTIATTTYLRHHTAASPAGAGRLHLQAMVHGYSAAIRWAAGFLTLSAALAALLVNHRPRSTPQTPAVDEYA